MTLSCGAVVPLDCLISYNDARTDLKFWPDIFLLPLLLLCIVKTTSTQPRILHSNLQDILNSPNRNSPSPFPPPPPPPNQADISKPTPRRGTPSGTQNYRPDSQVDLNSIVFELLMYVRARAHTHKHARARAHTHTHTHASTF